MKASDLMELCSLERMTLLSNKDYKNMSYKVIHSQLAYGFELSWHNSRCGSCAHGCYIDDSNRKLCIAVLLYVSVFIVVRYSYSEIKKMTGGFKEKLGEGGFGCVYKGKLRNGQSAAIKLLGKSKANGQDFINEVATIGRIHHTNVVQLVGFCAEGSKRALVYDFMPNGSLNNFIFSQERSVSLSWEKLHEISLGVAHGIQYLHRVSNEKAIEIGDGSTEEEKKIVKKMIIVGLWCTQMNPMNRPAMNEVVEMLEGDIESLQLPPRPVLNLDEKPMNTGGESSSMSDYSTESLVGFCAEGSKRALVYDFMPNESLNNFIFSQERHVSLSWEKLHEISLGVAHGIQYLHRGCEMQIIHFDNILFDEHFTPKVSNFGLARLCLANESLKYLTTARGTIGYMAPELFYKNIGRPDWVHDQVSNEKAIEIGDGGTEEEKKIVKKMVIAGLWCIQMNPLNRPAMNLVVEMLEGDIESLQLPPKPALNGYTITSPAPSQPGFYVSKENSGPVSGTEDSGSIQLPFSSQQSINGVSITELDPR
ncbi:hypothetical protein POTOM_027559 [Populus tomentosa]|uniref:non-specific serine/threonine protein kinase n=1 Tax=Populus tomentosa TaxID=118781 RepID=A0A8X8CMN4_POPTO|nr:hypothetical protein POTOM_027559 [Populus tomentosa]